MNDSVPGMPGTVSACLAGKTASKARKLQAT